VVGKRSSAKRAIVAPVVRSTPTTRVTPPVERKTGIRRPAYKEYDREEAAAGSLAKLV